MTSSIATGGPVLSERTVTANIAAVMRPSSPVGLRCLVLRDAVGEMTDRLMEEAEGLAAADHCVTAEGILVAIARELASAAGNR